MTRRFAIRRIALFMLASVLTALPQIARADRTVAVFFTGFGATPGTAGMDDLEATLASAFAGNPSQPFSSQVFAYTDLSQAFDFIDGFTDVNCLILVGHSFGADATIELVTNFLSPAGIQVDLLVQLDSVGIGDEVLPAGVAQGFNYYQISTGLFEPQGEAFVAGSTNFQVEDLYGVANSEITHTTIDCALFDYGVAAYAALFGPQPDLYTRIEDHIFVLCVAAVVPMLGPLGIATIVLMMCAIGYRTVIRNS